MRAATARQPAAAAAARHTRCVRAAARAAKSRSPPPAPANGSGAPAALPTTLSGQRGNVIQLEMEPQLEKELQENGGCFWRLSCLAARLLRLITLRAPPAMTCQQTGLACPPALAASRGCPVAGFRSTRRTKLIATIGPACDSEEMLEQMAVGGQICEGIAQLVSQGVPAHYAVCRADVCCTEVLSCSGPVLLPQLLNAQHVLVPAMAGF